MSQLVYRIEWKEANTLLVRLEEKGSRRVLYLDTLKQLAQEADREALSFLTKIHLRSPNASRGADTLSFNQIELAARQTNEAIRLMAKTGRLYFEKIVVVCSPQPLPILWKGERHSERSSTITALVESKPLQGIAFPGSPPWVFHEGRWSELSTTLSWKWLELFLKGPALLEGVQQKRFLEEEPPVVWKEKEEKPPEVFPELVLQDATGCFANLWMRYPDIGIVAFEDLAPTINRCTRLRTAEEQWEKDLLETGFIRKIVGATRYFCPGDRVHESLLFLLEIGWRLIDCKKRRVLRQTGIDLSVRDAGSVVEVRGAIHFEQKTAPLSSSLQKLWLDLDSESVGLIDRKACEPISALMQEGEWKFDRIEVPKSRFSSLAPTLKGKIDWDEKLQEVARGWSGSLPSTPPGNSFVGTLLPYQQKGLDWLFFLYKSGFSGLLADEMGLGKTVQVLAFFSQLRTNLPILVVMPTSLLYNWKQEIARFLPSIPVYLHTGANRLTHLHELQKLPLILTTYAILRYDEELLRSLSCEVVVLDESQAIKNSKTQAATAALQLQSPFRIALSGTPMENRLSEVASQFQFLMPGLVGAADSAELLKRRIRPYLLRRRKQDVQIELPEKIEQPVWIEMSEEQEAVYQEYQTMLKGGLLKKVELEGATAHRMEILEAILRLRQICCDPRLVHKEVVGAKLERLRGDVEEAVAENRKILIYSQFTSMLSLIRTCLADFHPLYLDGSMSYEERGAQVEQFQEDPESLVFLLSLKAGGAGLNLTAAEHVLIFDPWWNDAVEMQAIDRAHRIGQKKTVLAKRYLIVGSIEEKMLTLKEKKKAAAEELLDGQEETFNWTSEDLLHLLS